VPRIEAYRFGRVVVDGEEQARDVIVLPDRTVANWWRADGHELTLADGPTRPQRRPVRRVRPSRSAAARPARLGLAAGLDVDRPTWIDAYFTVAPGAA
jgi:hypothetical protein